MLKTNVSPPCAFGIGMRTEIRLVGHHLVTVRLRAGDMLRSDGGLVWATVDGEPTDVFIEHGAAHVVDRDCTMRLSAFGRARLAIHSREAVRQTLAERFTMRTAASAWRSVWTRVGKATMSMRPTVDPA